MYKTLPSALRRDDRGKGSAAPARGEPRSEAHAGGIPPTRPDQPLFSGLNLNGLSNLISGGMSFLGQLRRKTPTSSSSASTPGGSGGGGNGGRRRLRRKTSSDSSTTSSSADAFFDARSAAGGPDLIELSSFPCLPEPAGEEGQTGEGHHFVPAGSFNPTWCDLCGDLVWGLYDTGASRCAHCDYDHDFPARERH